MLAHNIAECSRIPQQSLLFSGPLILVPASFWQRNSRVVLEIGTRSHSFIQLSEVSTIDLEFSLATSKPGIYRFLIQDASLKLPRVYQVQSGSELELWYYALDKSRESSIPFEEVVEITTSVGEFQCDVMESSFEIDVKEHLDKQQVMLELRGHNIEQIHARTLLLQKQLALLIKQHS